MSDANETNTASDPNETDAVGAPGMDSVVARAQTGLASLEEAAHLLASVRARATHPSGLVTVEVNSGGGVCELWLRETLDGVDARDLGRAVVETAARAAELVARRRESVLASLAHGLTD